MADYDDWSHYAVDEHGIVERHDDAYRYYQITVAVESYTGAPIPEPIRGPYLGTWSAWRTPDGVQIERDADDAVWSWTRDHGWTSTPKRRRRVYDSVAFAEIAGGPSEVAVPIPLHVVDE